MNKISIRFFDDREVRAVWDDEHAQWWFNVIDIVAILNEQNDYTKANNYWRWLKRKVKNVCLIHLTAQELLNWQRVFRIPTQ